MGFLDDQDFVELDPGGYFDPYDPGWLPIEFKYGRFEKPGYYTVTFRYSTIENNVSNWLPGSNYLLPRIASKLKNVPTLDLCCSVKIEVTE